MVVQNFPESELQETWRFKELFRYGDITIIKHRLLNYRTQDDDVFKPPPLGKDAFFKDPEDRKHVYFSKMRQSEVLEKLLRPQEFHRGQVFNGNMDDLTPTAKFWDTFKHNLRTEVCALRLHVFTCGVHSVS